MRLTTSRRIGFTPGAERAGIPPCHGRTITGRGLRAVIVVTAILAGASCSDESSRNPVPAAFSDKVTMRGYDLVRFWGDMGTPDFDRAMRQQMAQVKDAAKDGKMPEGDRKASILAISGGGDEGAFAAGYLKGWSESGTRPTFEIITGVSTGALAAPFAFLGSARDHDLETIYTGTSAAQLYDARWDFGTFSNAVKDTAPLREMVEQFATDAFLDEIAMQYRLGRRLLVSTTNLDNQRPVIWDLSAIAASGRPDRRKLFTDIMLATSAVPGIFPPVKIRVTTPDGRNWDELHADGSVALQMFFFPPGIKLAENEKAAFGHTRERTLNVLRNGKLIPEYSATPEKAVNLLQRGVATLVKYQVVYDLRLLEEAAKHAQTRFRFMGTPAAFDAKPKERFDRDYAIKLFEAGRLAGSKGEWLEKVPDSPELFRLVRPEGRASR